jgi:hypothetical protein
MSVTPATGYEHIGQTHGCADQDHDMVHELSRWLDAVWRYDQYIANAEGKPDLQKFWRNEGEFPMSDTADAPGLRPLNAFKEL